MPNTKPSGRKPRFKRVSETPFKLTERDQEIIKAIHDHRFLNSEQIQALVEGSRQGILKRLHLLYHAGYLDRPRSQLTRGGNYPMVYALGNEGGRLMAELYDYQQPMTDWTSKNREVKNIYLEHTLMIAQAMTCLELACRKVEGIDFISPYELAARRTTDQDRGTKPYGQNQNDPLAWRVKTTQTYRKKAITTTSTVVPDSAFAFRFWQETRKGSEAVFFLEADRSTMPISASQHDRSSFYSKMLRYWESWRQNLFYKEYGQKNARLLTVTVSENRIRSMIEANKRIDPRGLGLRMFLFAPQKLFDLKRPERLFDRVWINGRGEQVSLID
jgi:predicted transcriptional regulator